MLARDMLIEGESRLSREMTLSVLLHYPCQVSGWREDTTNLPFTASLLNRGVLSEVTRGVP